MNRDYEQEIRYRLLKVLSQDADLSQREMAREMGISLGKVNYCLSELAGKGFIKINRFKDYRNKLKYLYQLTPRGIEAKTILTISFLKRKMAEYSEIERQIKELNHEVGTQGLAEISGDNTLDEAKRVL